MTISEAILSFSGLDAVSSATIQRVLTVRALSGADQFSTENSKQVNLCAADLYADLVNQPDFGEGGLSVTHSRKTYINTASKLYRENGEPEKAAALYKSINIGGRSTNRW